MLFNSIIPLPYYTPIFYNALLILIIFAVLQLYKKGKVKKRGKEYSSFILLLTVTLYMGLRPISGVYFTDMATYNYIFERYASGGNIIHKNDFFWHVFMKACSGIMTANVFFLICATLYITPLYIAVKKWVKRDSYLLFLMIVASFSFWAYGVNGIRNGIATSFFVLGLSYGKENKIFKYFIFLLAILIHKSIMIPLVAYFLTLFFKNPKHYLIGWLIAIPLSLALGSFWEVFFASLGFGGERAQYLTSGNLNNDSFAYAGFRWDFLLYSTSAVYAGYYFIIKKQFYDKIYIQLFSIYLTANAFWILVIRANFSNRFAYLSWFLIAIIIFYPFLKAEFFKRQHVVLAYVMLAYFGFTYIMF